MSANYPILPLGGSTLIRGFASLLAFLTYWLKELARARRHRADEVARVGGEERDEAVQVVRL